MKMEKMRYDMHDQWNSKLDLKNWSLTVKVKVDQLENAIEGFESRGK